MAGVGVNSSIYAESALGQNVTASDFSKKLADKFHRTSRSSNSSSNRNDQKALQQVVTSNSTAEPCADTQLSVRNAARAEGDDRIPGHVFKYQPYKSIVSRNIATR